MTRARLCVVLSLALLACPRPASATPITLTFAGPVTGYDCFGPCPVPDPFAAVVPLGTPVELLLTLDPNAPEDPAVPCKFGQATATLVVLGLSYTGVGDVWINADGFGTGLCVPGSSLIQIVIPGWGGGGPPLPPGWKPDPLALGGLELFNLLGQGLRVDKVFTPLYVFGNSFPSTPVTEEERRRFLAMLRFTPEPGSLVLIASGMVLLVLLRVKRGI